METLRTSWRTTLLWGLGMAAFMAFFVLILPALDQIDLVTLLESLPPAMMAAAGIQDAEVLATPEGLLALGFFGKMALFFAAYPAYMGMRVTTNEEDDGIMDMVLSLPIPRWQVIVEKFLAYSLSIVVLVLMVIGGMYFGMQFVDITADTTKLSIISLNLIPVLILVLAVTIMFGAVINRKQIVLALATGFIIVSYSIFTVAGMVSSPWMDALQYTSFFHYYNVERLLIEGTVLWHVAVMVVLSATLVFGSQYVFENRDIAV